MSDYKKQALEAVRQAAERQEQSQAVCFDESASVDERLRAFETSGSIVDEALFRRAMALVENPQADERLRAAALEKIAYRIGNDESLVDRVISKLNDRNTPAALKRAAIKVLQTSSFSSSVFPAKRPAYMGALRALIDDKNRQLSDVAIEYLALNSDEYVQRRLIEGLESPERQITEPERAVQYLAYDLHADHFAVLRRLAQNPPNEQTRKEALRNLAADSDSVGLLQQTLADRNESTEVRQICAVALQNLNPGGFQANASEIIEDTSEDNDLKVTLLNTLLHTPGADSKKVTAHLSQLTEGSGGEQMKSQARNLLNLSVPKSER